MKPEEKKAKLPSGIFEDAEAKDLVGKYLARAEKNLEFMHIISELSKNKDVQKALALPEDYANDEWLIITAYYSMYVAALVLLAKLGYRSKTHTATIFALETFFVKKELIEQKYLFMSRSLRKPHLLRCGGSSSIPSTSASVKPLPLGRVAHRAFDVQACPQPD